MSYEKAFNRQIARMHRLDPQNQTLLTIRRYMKEHREKCCYTALDRLGFAIGIRFTWSQGEGDWPRGKVGYYAGVQFGRGNPLNGESEYKELRTAAFDSLEKCHRFMAKEYVYTLMSVPDLERHVLGDGPAR